MPYIPDLDPTNPANTDQVSGGALEIRTLKSTLQDQFPSIGSAPVNRTAAELNAVTDKLTRFNGRGPGAITPAEGDYSLTLLGDVSISAPTADEVLQYNGSTWVNKFPDLQSSMGLWDGYAGKVTDCPYFTNARRTPSTALCTVKNDGTGGIGFVLTAVVDILITMNFTATTSSNNGVTTAIGWDGPAFTPDATLPGPGSGRIMISTSAAAQGGASSSASMVLVAGAKLAPYVQVPTSLVYFTLNCSVMRV